MSKGVPCFENSSYVASIHYMLTLFRHTTYIRYRYKTEWLNLIMNYSHWLLPFRFSDQNCASPIIIVLFCERIYIMNFLIMQFSPNCCVFRSKNSTEHSIFKHNIWLNGGLALHSWYSNSLQAGWGQDFPHPWDQTSFL
jgi:hypothetical protein